jgi:hypothetical protein
MESLRFSFDVELFSARSIAVPPEEPILQTTPGREDHPFTGSMPQAPEIHLLQVLRSAVVCGFLNISRLTLIG